MATAKQLAALEKARAARKEGVPKSAAQRKAERVVTVPTKSKNAKSSTRNINLNGFKKRVNKLSGNDRTKAAKKIDKLLREMTPKQ